MKNMKVWKLGLLVLILMILSACQSSPAEVSQIENQPRGSLEIFRDGYYRAVLPSWEETLELPGESIFMVHQQEQFVGINRYPNPPRFSLQQFLSAVEEDPDTYLVQLDELAGMPFLEYTTRENEQTMRIQAVLDYCQGHTYALFVGGSESVRNAELFQEVLLSSSCNDPYQIPDLQTGKIGMMVNPAGDQPWEGFYPALRLAKESGVQVLHTYLLWGEVEPTAGERFWDWQDALMGYRIEEGFEISLVVNVIHTAVRGPVPADLEGMDFDDPEFIQRFSEFILEVLDRYPVRYLSIGNEVNDYFVTHRDQISAYSTFFLAVRERIHEQYPDIPVAMTFAYHDAESTNAVDIIDQLNLGDFLPLTLYIYSPGFRFDRSPAELDAYLDRILSLAGETPVAIVETGWNTAESLGGSQGDQRDYVREVFDQLAEHQKQIEFISWFALHDSLLEDSYQSALTFLPANAPQAQDEEFMRDFVDFLNYFGLIENDGTPKEAWDAFQEEAETYLAGQGEGK